MEKGLYYGDRRTSGDTTLLSQLSQVLAPNAKLPYITVNCMRGETKALPGLTVGIGDASSRRALGTRARSTTGRATATIDDIDNMPHRVFKISELTRVIASHLTPTSSESAVNLACTCRCLEEPVLSTLWETQPSLHTLLRVLPEETSWDFEHSTHRERVVRDLGPSLEKSSAEVWGCLSSGPWGTRHQRTGSESNAMLLGCVVSAWMGCLPLGRTSSPDYASTHPPADGSQCYMIYFGASRNPIFLTPICSSPRI